jgi:peptide/nickel transport system substrate-binding protein
MRKRFVGLLASMVVVLAACSPAATPGPTGGTVPSTSTGSSAPETPAASISAIQQALFATTFQPTQNAQTGGTLVMGEWQPPDNLNPFYSTAFTTVEAIDPALRGFLNITQDGKYIADLADHVPTQDSGDVVIAPDGKTFTVKVTLRSGLQWSDGKPLTMNDFKATWTWATDKAQTGCTSCPVGWPEIDNIDVSSDGLTATLHFKEPYAGWLGFLTGGFFQKDWLASFPVADSSKQMPNSSAISKVPFSGPFMITNASKTEIDYSPNPNWHGGVDLAVGGSAHAPYLDGLKFQFFDTKDGMIAAFKSGSIDLAFDLTQADYPAIQGVDPSVGTAELQPAWQYEHLDLNNDPTHARGNGLWDPAVRKGIAEAINKPDLIAAAFPGQNLTPACSPSPPGQWFHKDETCPAFSVDQAKTDLTAAGYDLTNSTYKGKAVDLELVTTSGNPTRLTELQKVQGYLQAVGIKSHIVTADAGSVVFAGWNDTTPTTDGSLYRGTYDLGDFAYIIGSDPYNNYYFTYSSSQWPEKGDHSGANDTRFSDPNMDTALANLKNDVDLNKQLADAQTVQDAYNAGIPEIPLYYRAETTGIGAHVGGWPTYNVSSAGPTWEVEDWFSKP